MEPLQPNKSSTGAQATCDLFALVRHVTTTLQEGSHITQPEQEAWWIVEAILGKKRTALLATREHPFSAAQSSQLEEWLNRRTKHHEPLQYLIGWVPFCDLEITVKAPTLIPRPETEEWCSKLIGELLHVERPLEILDVCTGSGCIALALAAKLPQARVTGIDISTQAIELAQRNQEKLSISNAAFLQSDLYTAVAGKTFDLIVANPPYLSHAEYEDVEEGVRKWEDKQALTPGAAGIELYRPLIEQAATYLKPKIAAIRPLPRLVLEIGRHQEEIISALLQHAFGTKPTVWQDSSGRPRALVVN